MGGGSSPPTLHLLSYLYIDNILKQGLCTPNMIFPPKTKKNATTTSLVLLTLPRSVHLNLLRKYDEDFNYIYAGPIRAIIRNRQHHPTNILFKDLAAYSQDIEFMRRQYYHINQSGKRQIQQRLRLLGNFYGRALVMKYEYPMMLLTRNEETFRRRLRRMRKMIAADASSDDSGDESVNFESFSTFGFLHNLNHQESGEDISFSFEQQKSYDSSVHDIYENGSYMIDLMVRKVQQREIQESDVDHLICDIKDIDYEKTLEAYKTIQEQERENKFTDFSNLNKLLKKEEVPEGTILIPRPFKNRIETGSFEPWQEPKGRLNNTKGQKTRLTSYCTDLQSLKERKQKIRDKAAALLNRVKNSNYVSYSKYLTQNTEVEEMEEEKR